MNFHDCPLGPLQMEHRSPPQMQDWSKSRGLILEERSQICDTIKGHLPGAWAKQHGKLGCNSRSLSLVYACQMDTLVNQSRHRRTWRFTTVGAHGRYGTSIPVSQVDTGTPFMTLGRYICLCSDIQHVSSLIKPQQSLLKLPSSEYVPTAQMNGPCCPRQRMRQSVETCMASWSIHRREILLGKLYTLLLNTLLLNPGNMCEQQDW